MRVLFSALLASCALSTALVAQGQPLVPAQDPSALPLVDVLSDNTRISESCRIRLGARRAIADADGNGVIHIVASGITVEFEEGSVLRGAPRDAALDSLEGIGVRIDGQKDVTLRNISVAGFRCGILATEADGLKLEGARLRRNYAQKLHSIDQEEDPVDWLWPHENDGQEWWRNYGAGICVERSSGVHLSGIFARDQQNGILFDRVTASSVVDSDCSYLSGWGLAMWRSSDNRIERNRFDFCIRGYSHGVYNRGQDSAGILMFEQCSRNLIAGNSASFSGDGIFAFAGREALGEKAAPEGFAGHRRLGNNDNTIVGNRLNHNAAHGLELTFSFGNLVQGNEIEGNAICGIWGGFSQETAIVGNRFAANGDAGYGLERGAINIDHSRGNHIHGNTMVGDAAGIHLWSHATRFADLPWGQANSLEASANLVHGNRFEGVEVPVQLRGDVAVEHFGNTFLDATGAAITEGEAVQLEGEASWTKTAEEPVAAHDVTVPELLAPSTFSSRADIVMTPWGPWDHESVQWLLVARSAKDHHYRLLPADAEVRFKWLEGGGSMQVREVRGQDPHHGKLYRLRPTLRGVQHFRLLARIGTVPFTCEGVFLQTAWQVKHFVSPVDPREDETAWRAASEAEGVLAKPVPTLRFDFGMDGPAGLEAVDHFGTVATFKAVLPKAKWNLRTRSDDGIRVWIDGELVIDDWTHHGATPHAHAFETEARKAVEIRVEHFELDGAALLDVRLERDR